MSPREYWSGRQGRGPRGAPTITDLYRALVLLDRELRARSYYQEYYGFECVDEGHVLGAAKIELADHIESELGYRNAWPLPDDPIAFMASPDEYQDAEDRIFDIIEFLHDHVSSGIEEAGYFHSYSGCGWHYREFDVEPAQEFFRDRINVTLGKYGDGFVLTGVGQIEHRTPAAFSSLMTADPLTADEDIKARIDSATSAWRSRERTERSMQEAVRNLFDVLERLRPQVKNHMLSQDEQDLFNIANNFGFRHFNDRQKTDWESPAWLSWMFYVNLSTIHLVNRLLRRQDNREDSGPLENAGTSLADRSGE